MVKLSDIALSRILDEDERALLIVRYPIGEEPPDGEIFHNTLEEMFTIIPEGEDHRSLLIRFIDVDPSQEEPSLVSVDFILMDEPNDPQFNINFDI